MLGDVGRLRLEHQLRDIDMRRAFGRAHLAVDAKVRDGTYFFGAQMHTVGLLVKEIAQQIRLGARRCILAMRGAKDRAHALAGKLGPARPATIAVIRFQQDLIRLPMQRQSEDRLLRGKGRSQGTRRLSRIGIDDFTRIEYVLGIEDRLDLTKDGIKRANLPRDPGSARQAGPMLRADRAAQLDGESVYFFRDRPKARDVIGFLHVEKGTRMNLAGARVNEKARDRVVLLQDVLGTAHVFVQHVDRYADVFDEGDGLGAAFLGVQARQGEFADLPNLNLLFRFGCDGRLDH